MAVIRRTHPLLHAIEARPADFPALKLLLDLKKLSESGFTAGQAREMAASFAKLAAAGGAYWLFSKWQDRREAKSERQGKITRREALQSSAAAGTLFGLGKYLDNESTASMLASAKKGFFAIQALASFRQLPPEVRQRLSPPS